MRTHLRIAVPRRGRVILASAVTLSLLVFFAATHHERSAVAAPARDDQTGAGVSEAVYYLTSKYHVTGAEAMRRLQLQSHGAEMAAAVRAVVGNELLDIWFDQTGGGKETFLTSRPDATKQALVGKFDLAQVHVIRSEFTYVQLQAAADAVNSKLAGLHDPLVSVSADLHNQRVAVIYTGTDAKRALAVRSGVTTARSTLASRIGTVPVVVDTTPPNPDTGVPHACTILACGPDMRGGLRLHIRRDDGSWGSCTTAFNVKGSNGWHYVLTAGHCVTIPGPKRQYAYHNGLPVGWEKSTTNDSDPNSSADSRYYNNQPPYRDWALLPYQTDGLNWSSYWLNNRGAHNLVQSQCVAPSTKSCTNGAISITGVYTWQQLQVGWVVCATGTGTGGVYPQDVGYTPGTHCGSIQDKCMASYTIGNCNIVGADGIKADICSRDGDSGGPLFNPVDHMAYGLLSGGPDRTGACDLSNPDEYSVYTPLLADAPLVGDLQDATNKTGITMTLITTSTG